MFPYRCAIRWSDLDVQGHVNNAVIVDYLQQARVAFWQDSPLACSGDEGSLRVEHVLAGMSEASFSRWGEAA